MNATDDSDEELRFAMYADRARAELDGKGMSWRPTSEQAAMLERRRVAASAGPNAAAPQANPLAVMRADLRASHARTFPTLSDALLDQDVDRAMLRAIEDAGRRVRATAKVSPVAPKGAQASVQSAHPVPRAAKLAAPHVNLEALIDEQLTVALGLEKLARLSPEQVTTVKARMRAAHRDPKAPARLWRIAIDYVTQLREGGASV